MNVLNNIETNYFKSFAGSTSHVLPSAAGLYLLTGSNLVEPELGANGAGKTTFWDALVWCLYGKTARGVRGASVETWGKPDGKDHYSRTWVKVKWGDYEIARVRANTNSAMIDGEEVDQSRVDDLIGLSYDEFLHTVLMGQFGTFFFDLTSTQKLNLLNDVLKLDLWLKASDAAKVKANEFQDVARRMEAKLELLRQDLKRCKNDKVEILTRYRSWRSETEEVRQELRSQSEDAEKALDDARLRLDKVIARYRKARDAGEKWKKKLIAAADIRDELKLENATLKADMRNATNDFSAAATALTDGKRTKKCLACGQRIDRARRAEIVDGLDVKLQWAESVVTSIQKKLDHNVEKLDAANERMAFIDGKLNLWESRLESSNKKRLARQREYGESVAQIESIRLRLKLVTQDNPHRDALKKAKCRLKEAEKELISVERDFKAAFKNESGAAFWVTGFKDVRLWIVQRALLELEVEVNNALDELGLSGWSCAFDVERETKSGGTVRGFTVNVKSPGSPEGVPFELWSGGETQRLRLAGAMGLASLILARKGVTPAFEVWDEPTAHLSDEGVHDLLTALRDRAHSGQRRIWVVDHRALDSGMFDGGARVVRGESRTSIRST